MCRLLVIKSETPFYISPNLKIFSKLAKNSKEFQGHGWGCAYLDRSSQWRFYKNINPVWQDDFSRFEATTLLVVHARSAFEDRDIAIENNMPFFDGRTVFIFNGELRGVKIKEEGRIGAEKIFNYIRRFDRGDTRQALTKAVSIIRKRTRYIRGMNIIMVNESGIFVSSFFTEDEDYFTMQYRDDQQLAICSVPFPDGENWQKIENNSVRAW
ncbi:MAG: class II glutamine amidotransferase [SAR324 cluster bacterium]|nr:class II glutamine amidotransferase [SAR324 cluster bacterium]